VGLPVDAVCVDLEQDGGQQAPGLRGADDHPPVDARRDGRGGPLDAVDRVVPG
jgi:hypothetical protein